MEECSGACALPATPVANTDALCTDTNRCTCQFGCEAEDYFDQIGGVASPREYIEKNSFDPGFPEYETCKCHCLNGLTGINCDVPYACTDVLCASCTGYYDVCDDNNCKENASWNSGLG